MKDTLTCEVLIVGLGPVGATLAALLGDAGIAVLAIDKSTEVYPLPRAAHFDHEIMRTFQQLGIAEEVLRHTRPVSGYEFRSAGGEVLVSFGDSSARLAPSGWAGGYMFNQPGLEHALRDKLAASPMVDVLLGAAFERLEKTADGVRVGIRRPEGAMNAVTRFVVGCDGAGSAVRAAMGSRLDDLAFDEPWLVIDTIPRPGCRLPTVNLQICDPARPTTCVLMGPGRHRWEFMLLPAETTEDVLDDAFITDLLRSWQVDVDIERKAVYRFHGLVAERWRDGPILIAGDAAHQTPPFAGQGMCAGIRDAANLSWKLSAVLRGAARENLLDSYQFEREPNVRAYINLAIEMGRVVCTLDPVEAKARDARMLEARRIGEVPIPPAAPPPFTGPCIAEGTAGAGTLFPQPVQDRDGAILRLDDVLGAGAWLITSSTRVDGPVIQPQPSVSTFSLADPRLRPFRDRISAWLTAKQADAVLVRPDRYVFGTGTLDELTSAWSRALGSTKSLTAGT